VRLLRALLEELEALPDAMSPRVLRAEIEMDLAAANDYVARHGSFAELAREHYAAQTMTQFEVFANPVARARASYPFVNLGSDFSPKSQDS
jgi:hypothetical protein